MAINFKNIGYINFNKEYNSVVKKGKTIIGTNVSMSTSVKNKNDEYENQYFNAFIPQKSMPKNGKDLINKELCEIEGIVTKTVKDGKHYTNFTIFNFKKYDKENETVQSSDADEDDLPF